MKMRIRRCSLLLWGLIVSTSIGCGPPESGPPAAESGISVGQPPPEPLPRQDAPSPAPPPRAEDAADERSVMDRPTIRPYPDWTISETAADALGRMGMAAVPELRQALYDPDANVRYLAARVLARIGPDAVAAVPDLIQLLEDPNERVRRIATRALGQIGPRASQAVPALIRLLDPAEEAMAE